MVPVLCTLTHQLDLPLDDGGSSIKLYQLEMATNGDSFIIVYEGEESQYLCEGLTPGMTYLFKVRASSEGGMGSVSAHTMCAHNTHTHTHTERERERERSVFLFSSVVSYSKVYNNFTSSF